jgi:DNA-binding transcriptional LysR family regulator
VELRLVPAEVAAQGNALRDGLADAGLVRLPIDRDVFDAIPLYTEQSVVVVPRGHVVTATDEVTVADLTGETLLLPLDDVLGGTDGAEFADPERPATTAAAVERVAAGAGLLVVPQSLARLHHRKDVTYRVVSDAPTSTVALAWRKDRHDDLVETMIGIVRGRTVNSTRGQPSTPSAEPARRPAVTRKPAPTRRGTPASRAPRRRRGH